MRTPINFGTSYLDGSRLYGSSNEEVNATRTFNNGKLHDLMWNKKNTDVATFMLGLHDNIFNNYTETAGIPQSSCPFWNLQNLHSFKTNNLYFQASF